MIAAGKGKLSEDGQRIALEVKKGDQILFGQYSGTEVKAEGGEYKVVRFALQNAASVASLTPTLQKPEGFRVKASEGEVVALYLDPSATQSLKCSGFPEG